MKNKKLGKVSRLLLVISAALLITVIYLPIWRIELDAPQYPEGLALQIHADGLKGDVDIINGLNHYIGMKTLHNEDFIEFVLLPYVIVGFAVLFLLTALLSRKFLLYVSFGLFVAFGIIAMVDFWNWEYDYGHNLDPNAAIKVPGMAYQPPLIGFKQLLNFGAYSVPDMGGWFFIASGLLLLIGVIMEWRKKTATTIPVGTYILPMMLLLSSCETAVEKIVVGRDQCYSCKMEISDQRFGAALLTGKGKTYKFDDIACLLDFMKSGFLEEGLVKEVYLTDFSGKHELIPAYQAFLLEGQALETPMGGHVAAFSVRDSLHRVMEQVDGVEKKWSDIRK